MLIVTVQSEADMGACLMVGTVAVGQGRLEVDGSINPVTTEAQARDLVVIDVRSTVDRYSRRRREHPVGLLRYGEVEAQSMGTSTS